MKLYYGIGTENDGEIQRMHDCSLRILKEIGAVFHCGDAVEVFKKHGAKTDGQTVWITEEMVEDALRAVPKTFDWYGCGGGKITVGDGQTYNLPGYGPIYICRQDGTYEKTSHEHLIDMHKLTETSDVLDASNANILDVSYVDAAHREQYRLGMALKYCQKPLMGLVEGREAAEFGLETMRRFYGVSDERIIALGLIDTLGPMRLSTAMTEALMVYAENKQALLIGPGQTFGLTTPQSLAAAQTLGNAMILAAIVLAQLINPGTPVIYSSKYSGDDMRLTSSASYGAIEGMLVGAAGIKLARYYGLPVHAGSANTDAKVLDYQAGAEAFMGTAIAYLGQVDCYFQSCGTLDSYNAMSYEKFLLDEERIRAFRRLASGFEIDEDTLMFETMKKCGPTGQLFERTKKTYYRDCFMPKYAVRDGHNAWTARGCPTSAVLAAQDCEKRLESYAPAALDKEQEKILQEIIPEQYQ